MTDRNLDDHIRDALGDFKAEFEEHSWELLSDRMAADPELAPETEVEEDFDQTVKTKIHNINPSYQSAHWKIMAERIQQEFSLRRKLIRYKAAEAAMVLLIIFTLFNVFPGTGSQLKNKVRVLKEHIANIQLPTVKEVKELAFENREPAQQANSNKGESIVQTISETKAPATEPADFTFVFPNNDFRSSSKEKPPVREVPVLKMETVGSLNAHEETGLAFNGSPLLENNSMKTEAKSSKGGISKVGKKLLALFGRNNDPVASVETLNNSTISELDFQPEEFAGGKSEVAEIVASGIGMRVSMFAGPDYNYIKTPYDPIFDLERNSRFVPGYQAGITMSVKIRDVEFETGGIYSNKEYDPGIPTEFISSLPGPPIAVAFDNIQLNMLEVPLNLRFHFGKSNKWKFYGQMGASLHMAMVANYDKFPSNLDALFAGAPPGSNLTPKLEAKKFTDGLLEGGSFEENSYFTTNLGIGAERIITPRWSLFFQPAVKAYLVPTYNNGLGPNKDQISSISVLTGARVSLW